MLIFESSFQFFFLLGFRITSFKILIFRVLKIKQEQNCTHVFICVYDFDIQFSILLLFKLSEEPQKNPYGCERCFRSIKYFNIKQSIYTLIYFIIISISNVFYCFQMSKNMSFLIRARRSWKNSLLQRYLCCVLGL